MIWGETKRVKHFMIYRNLRDHSNRQWLSENNEWINKFCIQFFFFKIIRIFYIKVFEISQSSGLTFIWENVRKRRWIKIPDTDNLQVVTCMYLCLVFQKKSHQTCNEYCWTLCKCFDLFWTILRFSLSHKFGWFMKQAIPVCCNEHFFYS